MKPRKPSRPGAGRAFDAKHGPGRKDERRADTPRGAFKPGRTDAKTERADASGFPKARRDDRARPPFEKRPPREGAERRIEARERYRRREEGGPDPRARPERGPELRGGEKREFRKDRPARSEPRDADRRERTARPREGGDRGKPKDGALWIYGKHAALAALQNPARKVKRVLMAAGLEDWISQKRVDQDRLKTLRVVDAREIDRALHDGAVHQGIAIEVEELPRARLREDCAPDGAHRPVVVLDQITDPHNIGAIFRSAAAFGARAVIVQDRRTPPLAGALAKAAAGAVELVPCVEVVNVARALEGLKALGYHCAGLAGEGSAELSALPKDAPIALVLGAEGEGLRHLVASTCDALYRIPVDRRIDSLNVSNAAAIALYEASRPARA